VKGVTVIDDSGTSTEQFRLDTSRPREITS